MSGDTILRIQPGETPEDFVRRVADTAPPLTPELATRLRALLPINTQAPTDPPAHRQSVRQAA